jgi:hypothetical protein
MCAIVKNDSFFYELLCLRAVRLPVLPSMANKMVHNELNWFQKIGMRRYNARRELSGDFITNDMANAIVIILNCLMIMISPIKCGTGPVYIVIVE